MIGGTKRTVQDLVTMLWGWCNIQKGATSYHPLVSVSFHCSGEAFVGIMILESMCWMRGTAENGTRGRFRVYLVFAHSLKSSTYWLHSARSICSYSRQMRSSLQKVCNHPAMRLHHHFFLMLTRIVHNFIPALLLPGAIPSVFSGLKVFVGCNQQTKYITELLLMKQSNCNKEVVVLWAKSQS